MATSSDSAGPVACSMVVLRKRCPKSSEAPRIDPGTRDRGALAGHARQRRAEQKAEQLATGEAHDRERAPPRAACQMKA